MTTILLICLALIYSMKMNRSNSPNQICFSVTYLSNKDDATESLSFPPMQKSEFPVIERH